MRIGIDIDGTIRDIYSPLKSLAEELYNLKSEPIYKWTNYKIWNHFFYFKKGFTTWTSERENEFKQFWFNSRQTENIYYLYAKPYSWTKWALDKLRKDGHKIILISAAPTKKIMKYTLNWLDYNYIPFDEIHFVEYESKPYVECDVYLDDSPFQLSVLYAETNGNIFCMNRPWNKLFKTLDKNTEFHRVKDMREFYYKVRALNESNRSRS